MRSKKKSRLWKFDFVIEDMDGDDVDICIPSKLLEKIVAWVEENDCQMGGGYYPVDDNTDEIKNFRFKEK